MERLTQARSALELAMALLGNADSLLDDADLLHEAGRAPRAAALALVAAEELGKIYLCLGGMTGERAVPSATSREWRNHRDKLETARALELMFLDPDPDFDMVKIKAEIDWQMRVKMAALYVDHEDGRTQSPADLGADAGSFIERGRAQSVVLHGILDRVTPEVLEAMDKHGPDMSRLADALIDEEDPASTTARMRSVKEAAVLDDEEALAVALASALTSTVNASHDGRGGDGAG